jgi:tRNA (guanine37-N1)-methyltransferase
MRFEVITLFPELFAPFLQKGLIGKAHESGLITITCTSPREFAKNKHKSVDDAPYGGGSGMVMMPGPVLEALESREQEGRTHRVLLSPQGKPFDQAAARRLAGYPSVSLICGRYEGIDERVCEAVDEHISLGDFVMTGGEVAALAVIDASARLLPGVLGNQASTEDESHAAGLLEYPQYTRPPEFRGSAVPEVLLSGDHAAIARYRRRESLRRTRALRPDLFAAHTLDDADRKLLLELDAEASAAKPAAIYLGLVHYPVKDREGNIVTTAVTNLDVHDLSRSSRSYGLSGYYVITPIEAQRELVGKILEHWVEGSGRKRVPERGVALSLCTPTESIDSAIAAIEAAHGRRPVLAVTAARLPPGLKPESPAVLRARMQASDRPWLLLFGTGHGLAPEVLTRADVALPPIRPGVYNHLSVRAAGAIMLDRLFGDSGA